MKIENRPDEAILILEMKRRETWFSDQCGRVVRR